MNFCSAKRDIQLALILSTAIKHCLNIANGFVSVFIFKSFQTYISLYKTFLRPEWIKIWKVALSSLTAGPLLFWFFEWISCVGIGAVGAVGAIGTIGFFVVGVLSGGGDWCDGGVG